MWFLHLLFAFTWFLHTSATILQNGQVRDDPYPGQAQLVSIPENDTSWREYSPDANEISFKGRWDSRHISWWSAPGIKFGFTGEKVALSFGNYTDQGVLVAYRIAGLDWQFSNVTANATYQFIGPWTPGLNFTSVNGTKSFEMRVQLAGVSVAANARLSEIPEYNRTVEIIGDSLSAGLYGTYEGLSSWAYNFAAGLGNVEFSITAYPGICLDDRECWENAHGQTYQWHQTSDTSQRAGTIYGANPEKWNFTAHRPADLVVINLGTNDAASLNNVPGPDYYASYVKLVDDIHGVWPQAQIIIMSLWGYFNASGATYIQTPLYVDEIRRVYEHYEGKSFVHIQTPLYVDEIRRVYEHYEGKSFVHIQTPLCVDEIRRVHEHCEGNSFVHYFDTTGILQHNDITPEEHPTDVGHVKVASHLMQYVQIKFGWEFAATGPEIQHDTLYWNNEDHY